MDSQAIGAICSMITAIMVPIITAVGAYMTLRYNANEKAKAKAAEQQAVKIDDIQTLVNGNHHAALKEIKDLKGIVRGLKSDASIDPSSDPMPEEEFPP
jgi:hypothetical protein